MRLQNSRCEMVVCGMGYTETWRPIRKAGNNTLGDQIDPAY